MAISALPYYVYNGSLYEKFSDFIPSEELIQHDGDVSIFLLSANHIRYTSPVDDPWYAAHQIGHSNNSVIASNLGGSQKITIYYADEPAPALACKLQYQTCDPSLPPAEGCSPWGGIYDVSYSLTPPKSKREQAIKYAFGPGFEIRDVVVGLGASALTSTYRLNSGIQASLPVNQWQLEVENWINISLASKQGGLLDAAIGPGDPAVLQNCWEKPSDTQQKQFCKSQVSKGPDHSQISSDCSALQKALSHEASAKSRLSDLLFGSLLSSRRKSSRPHTRISQ